MIKFRWLNPFEQNNKYHIDILFGISNNYNKVEHFSQKNWKTFEFEKSKTEYMINITFYFIVPFLNVDIVYVT